MNDELLKLAEQVKAAKGWSESYLARAFGHGTIMDILRDPKRRCWPETAESFKAWLEEQLREVA